MTLYTVHIYREMRLTYTRIDAPSHEEAARIARDTSINDADDIDDCEGESFSALVDIVDDEEFEHSRMIDFENHRLGMAAGELLEALDYLLEQTIDMDLKFGIDLTEGEADARAKALAAINPFYAARMQQPAMQPRQPAVYARLPAAPINASPVPHLTSLYHFHSAGEYGDRSYPGNCGGNLIKDLLKFFRPASVFDPMTGSGTCRDVCEELGIYCYSSDMQQGFDACDASKFPRGCFDFCWIHPPYWRMKLYTNDSRDLSRAATLREFLDRYRLLIENCAGAITPTGKVAILMGDYQDREEGYVPLVYWTKYLAMRAGLRQSCTDIIRFSYGASSSKKVYRSSFIPGLHDVCMIFEKET